MHFDLQKQIRGRMFYDRTILKSCIWEQGREVGTDVRTDSSLEGEVNVRSADTDAVRGNRSARRHGCLNWRRATEAEAKRRTSKTKTALCPKAGQGSGSGQADLWPFVVYLNLKSCAR